MDVMKKEESVCMSQNAIINLYDNKSDSVIRVIPFKPVTSYNKSSTILAEHKSDNKEIPLKKNSSGTLHIETRNFGKNQSVTYQLWLLGC